MSKYTTKFIQRFRSKIQPDAKDSCWEWTAGKDRKGYGKVRHGRATKIAHRVAYELFVGPIPEGLHVRHKCDNPGCVNPYHLEIGTNADNMRDRDERGRNVVMKGSKNGSAKLCEPEVVLIKKFLLRHPPVIGGHGGQCAFLARWFWVTRQTVGEIHRGEIWTHVTVE